MDETPEKDDGDGPGCMIAVGLLLLFCGIGAIFGWGGALIGLGLALVVMGFMAVSNNR